MSNQDDLLSRLNSLSQPGIGRVGVGAPGIGAPGIGAPGIGISPLGARPGIGAPGIGIGAPGIGAPGIGISPLGARPGIGAPGIGIGAPGIGAPGIGIGAPGIGAPGIGAPSIGAPVLAPPTSIAPMAPPAPAPILQVPPAPSQAPAPEPVAEEPVQSPSVEAQLNELASSSSSGSESEDGQDEIVEPDAPISETVETKVETYIEPPQPQRPRPVRRPKNLPPGELPGTTIAELPLPQIPVQPAGGQEIRVNPDIENPISTVVAKAPENSTIVLPEGRYIDAVTLKGRHLNFRGEGRVTVWSTGDGDTFNITGDSVITVSNIILKQKEGGSFAACAIDSGYVQFHGGKLYATSGGSLIIKNNAIVSLQQSAVQSTNCTSVQILGQGVVIAKDTKFSNSLSTAVVMKQEAKARFTNCTFEDNIKGAINCNDDSQFIAENGTMFRKCGVEINACGKCHVLNDCTFNDVEKNGLLISGSSEVQVFRTSFLSANVDIRDLSAVRFNANRFNNSGVLVWGSSQLEASGDTYKGKTAAAIRIINTRVGLQGTSITGVSGYGLYCVGSCRVECQKVVIKGCGNYGVVTSPAPPSEDNSSISTEGPTISLLGCEVNECKNTGILLNQVNEAVLQGTVVKQNEKNGIEVVFPEKNKQVIPISQCTIGQNGQSGLYVYNAFGIQAQDCTFEDNRNAGVEFNQGKAKFGNCTVRSNFKGGVVLRNRSKFIFEGKIVNNKICGVFIHGTSRGEINNSAIQRNTLGVVIDGSLQINKCKISDHDKTGLQVSGTLNCESCEFSNNGTAVMCGNNGRADIYGGQMSDNETSIELHDRTSIDASDIRFVSTVKNQRPNPTIFITAGATGNFKNCEFNDNHKSCIICEGVSNVDRCVIAGPYLYGMVFSGQGKSMIQCNQIINNGECGIQVIEGSPEICDNYIMNHSKFGVYISPKGQPDLHGNAFKIAEESQSNEEADFQLDESQFPFQKMPTKEEVSSYLPSPPANVKNNGFADVWREITK